jgi:Protein of unknown function (DUF3309)
LQKATARCRRGVPKAIERSDICRGLRKHVVCGVRGRRQMYTILIIILVLLLIGALPTWPYSTGWGYYPSGGLGLVLIIILILVLLGRT